MSDDAQGAPKDDVAARQQFERNREALNQRVAELVGYVAEVGNAKIKAEDHRTDRDNMAFASDHRRLQVTARGALDRAVDAYVRLMRGPQPPAAEPPTTT